MFADKNLKTIDNEGGAGKTSLIRAFMNENHRAPVLDGESITDGIDITTWSKRAPMRSAGTGTVSSTSVTPLEEQTVTYSVWDFAGQTLYYNTHQFFLTGRAIYFLIWNIRQGYEHAGLEFWLNSITCHAPTAPIFVVGTHADQVHKAEAPVSEMMRKFPSIVKFVNISCLLGTGISELLNDLLECTRQQPYIGEQIPEVWLKFERDLIGVRTQKDYLEWSEVQKVARKHAIYEAELNQVIRFLHDLGSIQHFDSDLLRDIVIIKAQWLVDVMKCLVSVKNNLIKDGKLHHNDINRVWHDYDRNLHEWLLRMTEIFDLTFPMTEQPVNIVPCLLPHSEPTDLNWPSETAILSEGQRQVKMFYNFDYLPAGLFNRLQVRLCQYSDTYNIWQRGSLLSKNNHMALVAREGQNNFIVKVVGFRPENLLMVIHETFEGLVQEAFRGVKYEYLIPCTKCLKQQVSEPHLFSSMILRRAVDMHTLVLQCHVHFHFLSVPELQAMMPSEQMNDYDKQFERQMNDLIVVEDGLMKNVIIVCSHKDIDLATANPTKLVNPSTLFEDLKKQFTVFFEPHLDQVETGELLNNLARAEVVVHLISDAFVEDKLCCDLFRLSREDLRKPVHLAILGEGKKWQSSNVGVKITGDKYVNFQRINMYESKLKELKEDIATSLAAKTKTSDLPPAQVFLSYCWTNSREAVECGDVKVPKNSAMGFGDPRGIKTFLEKNGIVTWIDKERMGASNVYSEICAALKGCKVVVACISDEYALSEMCRKEFLFAMKTLQMPMIIAVVGTGSNWDSSEIGFAAIEFPRVDLQVANEDAFPTLLQLVRERIEEAEQEKQQQQQESTAAAELQWRQQEAAFKEQYELLQRRLFRYLTTYEEGETHFPRIFVVDFYKKDNGERENAMQSGEDLQENNIRLMVNSDAAAAAGGAEESTENAEFCFKILCEHEGGWHSVHEGYPVDLIGPEAELFIELAGPYLARVSRVLKHHGTNLHFVINDMDGARFMTLAEKCKATFSLFEPIYKLLRGHLMSKDVLKTRGGLKRCHLPSGKILWLCPQHQCLPRVTLIPEAQEVPARTLKQQAGESYLLMSTVVDSEAMETEGATSAENATGAIANVYREPTDAGTNETLEPLFVSDILPDGDSHKSSRGSARQAKPTVGTEDKQGQENLSQTQTGGPSSARLRSQRLDADLLKNLKAIMHNAKYDVSKGTTGNDKDVYSIATNSAPEPNPASSAAFPTRILKQMTAMSGAYDSIVSKTSSSTQPPTKNSEQKSAVSGKPPQAQRPPFQRSRSAMSSNKPTPDTTQGTQLGAIQEDDNDDNKKRTITRRFSAPSRPKPTSQACHIL